MLTINCYLRAHSLPLNQAKSLHVHTAKQAPKQLPLHENLDHEANDRTYVPPKVLPNESSDSDTDNQAISKDEDEVRPLEALVRFKLPYINTAILSQ